MPSVNSTTPPLLDPVKISRRLSHALRHEPESLGLKLSTQGWVSIDDLLYGLWIHEKVFLPRDALDKAVEVDEKKRFTISDDGFCIRAAQGHSTPQVRLELPAVVPPIYLYHGTTSHALELIQLHGLRPGQRQHVHLSEDLATSRSVGARYARKPGTSVHVLQIRAQAFHAAGGVFHQADNGVWLTAAVPVAYLEVMESSAEVPGSGN